MSVTAIDTKALRTMQRKEGLVIQGCGGDLDEWVEGINDMLTEEGILLDGTRMNDCKRFTQGEQVCLLFPFEGAKLDMGKLAIWRLKTHGTFGGTWLSDYVPNCLGGFIEPSADEDRAEAAQQEKAKPDCPLIGADGNIFNLLGIASRTLRRSGMAEEAKEMTSRVFSSGSYHDALNIVGEYVNITSVEESESEAMDITQ